MGLMERIEKMDPKEIANRPEVKALWDKSLFWSLSHRRGARFPLGLELAKEEDCWMPFKSKNEPVGLTEVELALLCWVGAGTSGLMKHDVPYTPHTGLIPIFFEGRVFPSACNVWYHYLIFCNDDGIFLYTPHVPTKSVEIDTQKDMEIIFRAFKEGVTQLSDKPIDVGTDVRFASRAGVPMMFKPGTTSFLAVADMTIEYINVLLGNNARPEAGRRTRVVDDEAGDIPALQAWVDNGYLAKAPRVPMFVFETRLAYSMHHSLAVMTHNIHLCATVMGLGVYLHSGYNHIMLMGATPVMKGLGFRVLSDKRGIPNPIGIDGVIHAHHPPYMSVDEAVDDVWDMKYKPGYGRFSRTVKEGDEVLYRGFSPKPRAVHRPYKNVEAFFDAIGDFTCPETVQITKDILNYFYSKYGRFPKYYDAMYFGPICQTAHMDIDFYDEYYLPDAITQEAREHLRIWHK